ncbi:MAG: 7-carboxy-7-deazaguanine synthase QueE [Halobacteriota archaeon]|nr:7-carboxy-7-deazaguanine synthase QueE [Halobacteriota archaeon]
MKEYVCEIFSSFQGEGVYVGRRQVFVRMAGCPLNCCYCDTQKSREMVKLCRIEVEPGMEEFMIVENPIDIEEVVSSLARLMTADANTVSFTGGEPLMHEDFLFSIAKESHNRGWKNYLETSAPSKEKFRRVVDHFDYTAIDIKLPDHEAVPMNGYKELYENEISCVEISCGHGLDTIVKVVVLSDTDMDSFRQVCIDVSAIQSKDRDRFHFVLQPVTPIGRIKGPSRREIYELAELAGSLLEGVRVIPQMHNVIGIL